MTKEVYLKIYGRVQAVGYRKWAKKTADKIGSLSGWVKNIEDKSVEIFLQGEEDNIDKMIISCHQGSLFCRVDKLEIITNFSKDLLLQIKEGKFYIA